MNTQISAAPWSLQVGTQTSVMDGRCPVHGREGQGMFNVQDS